MPGVRHERLPGLRPKDAEALLRSCKVTGTSQRIQDYLKTNCDCHPLVTGAIAGLVAHYLPDRGNFDGWVEAVDGGAALDLADLDLIQRRNHILQAAIDALPDPSRQLLSILAILSEAVDAETLSALDPQLPPLPDDIDVPANPATDPDWRDESDQMKTLRLEYYETAVREHAEYERAVAERKASLPAASRQLAATVGDLESRGLIQYDPVAKRYDLHPVVRGIAAGGLNEEERDRFGRRVVDHFSRKSHVPYEEAETLEELSGALHVVRTLLQMGRHKEAFGIYQGRFSTALLYNLEAHSALLSLIRPLFTKGWHVLPSEGEIDIAYVTNDAALCLKALGQTDLALEVYSALLAHDLEDLTNLYNVETTLTNIASALVATNRIAAGGRARELALQVAILYGDAETLFRARLDSMEDLRLVGRWIEAEELWRLLKPMERPTGRHLYRPGMAELEHVMLRYAQGKLEETDLARVEQLARKGKNRNTIRNLYHLRGEWSLRRGDWPGAADQLHEAVRMAHAIGTTAASAEALLAVAKFHLEGPADAWTIAERLSLVEKPAHRELSELWLTLGDHDRAKAHALAAFRWACADGEPHVRRQELIEATDLLQRLGVQRPEVPQYNPADDPPFRGEQEAAAAIAKMQQER